MTAVSMLNFGPQSLPWQFYFWWNTQQGNSPQIATHLCIVCNVKQQTLQWHRGANSVCSSENLTDRASKSLVVSAGTGGLGAKDLPGDQSKLLFFHWFWLTKLTLVVFNWCSGVSLILMGFQWFSISMIQLTTSYLMRKSWCHGFDTRPFGGSGNPQEQEQAWKISRAGMTSGCTRDLHETMESSNPQEKW